MKALLAAALVLASATVASAEPWQTDSTEANGELIGLTAYQWESGGGNVLLGYECDAMWGFEALYVQTEELYDDTTSYAPDVPTTFTIDGVAYQMNGVFQNREGYLFTYYDAVDYNGYFELFERLAGATGTIEVAFYDTRFSFSAEGVGAAMSKAAEACF